MTELPFLNWHYGVCDDAISMISEDVHQMMRHSSMQLRFRTGVEVVSYRTDMVDENTIQLGFAEGIIEPTKYSFVIVCSGFRNERDTNKEYWCSDDLERLKAEGKITSFIISGVGDGGLIDALRLVYRFDYGRLAIDWTKRLSRDAPQIVDAIKNHEQGPSKVSGSSTGDVYLKAVQEIVTAGESIPKHEDTDETARLRELYSYFIGCLDRDRHFDLRLVDYKFKKPWESPAAAPIHKLMIAFAFEAQFPVQFVAIKDPKDLSAMKDLHDGRLRVDGNHLDPDKTHFVHRHGAEVEFGGVLASNQNEREIGATLTKAGDFYDQVKHWENHASAFEFTCPSSGILRQKAA